MAIIKIEMPREDGIALLGAGLVMEAIGLGNAMSPEIAKAGFQVIQDNFAQNLGAALVFLSTPLTALGFIKTCRPDF